MTTTTTKYARDSARRMSVASRRTPEGVIVEQHSVREPHITIGELIAQVSEHIGEQVQVLRFSRFHMGLA